MNERLKNDTYNKHLLGRLCRSTSQNMFVYPVRCTINELFSVHHTISKNHPVCNYDHSYSMFSKVAQYRLTVVHGNL